MIRTIILDLDGPILDGRFRHYQCYSDILCGLGFTPIALGKYWQMKRQRIDRRQQLAAGGAAEIYDQFLESWMAQIEQKKYLALDRLQPGAIDKVREWESTGARLILVTMRNNNSNLHWQLESVGLAPFFSHVLAVGTAGEGNAKAAAAKVHIDSLEKQSALWIGDTESDIEAARLLGIRVCAVSCGLRTREYLAELSPDFLVEDLQGVDFLERTLL